MVHWYICKANFDVHHAVCCVTRLNVSWWWWGYYIGRQEDHPKNIIVGAMATGHCFGVRVGACPGLCFRGKHASVDTLTMWLFTHVDRKQIRVPNWGTRNGYLYCLHCYFEDEVGEVEESNTRRVDSGTRLRYPKQKKVRDWGTQNGHCFHPVGRTGSNISVLTWILRDVIHVIMNQAYVCEF